MSEKSAAATAQLSRDPSKRIMVCDDDPAIASALQRGLGNAGFVVEVFTDSREALSNYTAGAYQLVILDEMMPNIDGIVLYKLIKEKDPAVRACFLTGYDSAVRRALPNFDPHFLLEKPVSIQDLVKFVNSAISLK